MFAKATAVCAVSVPGASHKVTIPRVAENSRGGAGPGVPCGGRSTDHGAGRPSACAVCAQASCAPARGPVGRAHTPSSSKYNCFQAIRGLNTLKTQNWNPYGTRAANVSDEVHVASWYVVRPGGPSGTHVSRHHSSARPAPRDARRRRHMETSLGRVDLKSPSSHPPAPQVSPCAAPCSACS